MNAFQNTLRARARQRSVAVLVCALALSSVVLPWQRLFSQAGDALPGDPGRVAYEMGFAYLLTDAPGRARPFLEEAMRAGGAYGDLARLELLRLQAGAAGDEDPLAAIRQILLGFEDRTRIPQAWYAAAQALEDAGRYPAALELSLELALRYPDSEQADDALFAAARLHHGNGHFAAALEKLFQIVQNYKQSDRIPAAYYLIAEIYSTPGEHYNPAGACTALTYFDTPAAQTADGALADARMLATPAARRLYRDFCEY